VTSAAAGAATPAPSTATARLHGQFLLAGRITTASNVPGEHRGQTVLRTWTFQSTCPTGQCPQVSLARQRSTGIDQVVLQRTGPGTYRGSGSFYAPLRCGARTYPNGALVPFTLTVTITAAGPTSFGELATRVTATYTNRSRRNLTTCVGVLGHDAATYHGRIVPPTTTSGAAAQPISDRSPAGS
jgi:hypothetical protein